MTPRDHIVAYLAVLDSMRDRIDTEYTAMADALIGRLDDAGFVIVPRKATEAMDSVGYVAIDMHTDASGPLQDAATKVWDAMVEEGTKP